MTKAKHDTVYGREAISDARPNKKARTADTGKSLCMTHEKLWRPSPLIDLIGGESNDVDTGKETDVTQHHEETDE